MKKYSFCYNTKELIPYIDWSYFYHAWGIGAKEQLNAKAQEVKKDAIALLNEHADNVGARAIFALCDAHSAGDSIMIESTELPLLRQQHRLPGEPNLCLSDFVSPNADKIGLFATSVGENFAISDSNDPYTALLKQAIASRLAEAAATLLHMNVRRNSELWGYAPNETLTPQEMNAEKFQGIRPAIGYPSLPDQSVIFIIDNLLHLREAGIRLTPNGAMIPHAAVCGLMISHPAARYFAVGPISEEQLLDYSRRRALKPEELYKFLYKNIQEQRF